MTRSVRVIDKAADTSRSEALVPLSGGLGPISREIVCFNSPQSKAAEAVRTVARQIEVHVGKGARSFALVADGDGRGTSFLAANLAVSCAQSGLDTILIDANVTAPQQGRLFGIPRNTPGLVDWLRLKHPLQARSQFGVMRLPNLAVVPAGASDESDAVLEHVNFRSIILGLSRAFQVAIIDSPSANRESAAMAAIRSADQTLIVARQDHTPLAAMRNLQTIVQQCRGEVGGIVLSRF
jgi:Mrp family chromosome partitioning ATPase